MGIATLSTWLITAGIGAYMLRSWIAHGGRQRRRAGGGGLPPVVIYGHAGLASTGLAVWIGYLAARLPALAWAGAGLLMPVVGLGLAMVTVWTPYPSPAVAGPGALGSSGVLAAPEANALAGRLTDETLAAALTDDVLAGRLADEVVARMPAGQPTARKPRGYLTPLVPVGHGVAALTTVLLATVTAVSAR